MGFDGSNPDFQVCRKIGLVSRMGINYYLEQMDQFSSDSADAYFDSLGSIFFLGAEKKTSPYILHFSCLLKQVNWSFFQLRILFSSYILANSSYSMFL